jgi:hypothetical protein
MDRCEHFTCRCIRAQELTRMVALASNPYVAAQLREEAHRVYTSKVDCRLDMAPQFVNSIDSRRNSLRGSQ